MNHPTDQLPERNAAPPPHVAWYQPLTWGGNLSYYATAGATLAFLLAVTPEWDWQQGIAYWVFVTLLGATACTLLFYRVVLGVQLLPPLLRSWWHDRHATRTDVCAGISVSSLISAYGPLRAAARSRWSALLPALNVLVVGAFAFLGVIVVREFVRWLS